MVSDGKSLVKAYEQFTRKVKIALISQLLIKGFRQNMTEAYLLCHSLLFIVPLLPATTLPSHRWTSRTVFFPVSSLPVPHKQSAS